MLASPLILSTATATPSTPAESGIYQEAFTTNTAKRFVQGADWNIWENRLRLDRLDGAEKQRPAIAVGNDGYATAVWLVDSGSKADIYAQRLDSQGNRVWETDVIVNSGRTAGDWLTWADVAVDSQGNSTIVWVDRRDASTYIYAQKLSSTGTRLWASDIRVSANALSEDEPSIAINSTNQTIVIWQSSDGSIYGQKLSPSGAQLWGGGIRINASTSQWLEHPDVAIWPDTTIAVIWQEDNSIHNIIAQRLDSNGNRLWVNDRQVDSAEIGQTDWTAWPIASIDVDSNGDMVVAWVDNRAGTNIYAQRLNSSGTRQWPGDLFINAASDFAPGLSLDASGNAYISWVVESWQGISIQKLNRNGEKIWVQNLCTTYTFGLSQDIGANGDIVGLWFGDWGHLFAQRVTTSGYKPWRQDVRVNYDNGTVGQFDPDIAPDGNGDFFAVWRDTRTNDYQVYAQRVDRNGNNLWTTDIRVGSTNTDEWDPSIAVDTTGRALVVWADGRNGASDIYAQGLDAQGNRLWTSDMQVNSNDNGTVVQNSPSVAIDSAGNFFVAWQDNRNGGDIVAQKLDLNGNRLWLSEVRVNSDVGTAAQSNPVIAVSGNGVVVAWIDKRNGDYDIFAQKLTNSGAKVWANDIRVNSDISTTSQRFPDIAADSSGNTVVVWADRRNANSDIYGQKLGPTGNKLWASDVRIDSDSETLSQVDASITIDGSSNAYIVWLDERSGYWDTYAQKLNSNGSKQWVTDVRINSNIGTVYQMSPIGAPAIVTDALGDIFAVWIDRRNGNNDIYAQRFNSVGNLVWLSDLQVVYPESFYLPSGAIESKTVDTIISDIQQATLTTNYQANGGSVQFYLTNNGGANWVTATLGTATVFTTTGSDLRWRAVLTSDPVWRQRSPFVTSLRIDYSTQIPYADDYESDDNCLQAKPIAINGAAQAHTFHQNADADWTWFDVISGTTYILQTTNVGSAAQTTLELHPTCVAPPTGSSVSFGNGLTLNYTADHTGSVFVKVKNHAASTFGPNTDYRLSARVVQPVALAIIVAGHDGANSAQGNITYASDFAYRVFLQAGLGKANIRYLAPDVNHDADGNGFNDDIAGMSTPDNVRDAIQTWARTRGLGLGVPLYIYFVDHGLIDSFKAAGDQLTQQISATNLNLWLGNLEATTGADNLNVIFDACYSGSFIDVTPAGLASIAGHNRVIIASTTSNWNAYGPGDGNGLYFSNAFFSALENQQSLQASFEAGRQAAAAQVPEQQAWLDDNGDQVFTAQDGALATSRALRRVTLSGQSPRITSLNLTSVNNLQAQVVDDSVWVNVTVDILAPDYVPPQPDGTGTTRILSIPIAILVDLNATGLFTATYPFTRTGWYRLVAHAEDTEGNLALPYMERVCVNCTYVYLPLVRKNN
jgi:hypothetical protein